MTTPPAASPSGYRFGDITLDAGRRRVRCGESELRLGKLTYELLVVLAEAAPRVVTREELIAKLWNGRYVSSATLKQRVILLRQALGDDARNPRYIQVIRGQGYRLIPTVDRHFDVPTLTRPWWLPASVAAVLLLGLTLVLATYFRTSNELALEGVSSVAVFPFDNRSSDADDNVFVSGIHDEILTRLARFRSLKVIARASVTGYRASSKSVREIAQELDVAAVLQGSVQRAGDAVRVNVRLLDAESEEHLWAEIYDRELTAENIFAIQSELAIAVASALHAKLSPEEVARNDVPPTISTVAYSHFLSGNDYMRRVPSPTNWSLAIQQYERAVDEDPEFALAWAALSQAHVSMLRNRDSELNRQKVVESLDRAARISPDSGEVHLVRGQYALWVDDYRQALAHFDRAEMSLPRSVDLLMSRGEVYRALGEWEKAISDLEVAVQIDPRSVVPLLALGRTYAILRDYTSAEERFNQTIALAPDCTACYMALAHLHLFARGDVRGAKAAYDRRPVKAIERPYFFIDLYERDFETALRRHEEWMGQRPSTQISYEDFVFIGANYQLMARPEEAEPLFLAAREQLEARLEGDPDNPRLLLFLAQVWAGLGDRTKARSLAYRAIEVVSNDAPLREDFHLRAIRNVFAIGGDADAAIDELDAYLAAPGLWSIEGLSLDPRFDSIRDDTRFEALVQKYARR